MSSFNINVLKIMIIYFTVPEIWCMTDRPTDGQADGKK